MASCPQEDKYGYDDNRFEKAVDAHFHCSICYNVLKDPMMCMNNEHVFCRGCITEHLTVNSHTCPECNEHLTVETLRRGPRMVINYLSELKIKCDYSSRSCQEFIRLEELGTHVQNCGFAPVKCSNEECGVVVNKLELVHHESSVCEFRKVKCHNCIKIENDVKRMEKKMEDLASKKDVEQMKAMIVQLFENLRLLENASPTKSGTSHASTAIMEDILVVGGWESNIVNNKALKSVERFSWKHQQWERMSSMKTRRAGATSFVYENRVFVAGGSSDSTIIEVLDLNEERLQWSELATNLPYPCKRLLSVVHHNRAILFCTLDDNSDYTDVCLELSLFEPYVCKELGALPEPARRLYRVAIFERKVLILGGKSNTEDFTDVLEFDLTTNAFKEMPPLPCSLRGMAVVRWGEEAVLLGGVDKDECYSKKVYMYNSKSGETTEMPSMLKERSGCSAIITGNTIVVMGGRAETGRVRSVEALTLGGYSWRHLPAMNDVRSASTAVVLPLRADIYS